MRRPEPNGDIKLLEVHIFICPTMDRCAVALMTNAEGQEDNEEMSQKGLSPV